MTRSPDIIHYFDYKSPYAYLAQAELFELAERGDVGIEWRPLTLDIPKYLGSAELDENGNVIAQSRNAHQWRRVKYSYMDCRREANRRGLTLRGPRKIFDSTLAHIGFLFAAAQGNFRTYHETVFERFWRRDLDIEDIGVIEAMLCEGDVDTTGFTDYAETAGRAALEALQHAAEQDGVFGVPSYVVDGELFWGAERLERAMEKVRNRNSA
jgi:2-hydroxychromene-2-carboxylate isomerase